MSNTFKKGDKVRCVRSSRPQLAAGHEYEISFVSTSGSYVGVNGSSRADWFADRFVLVEAAARKFKAGDKVKCLGATGPLIAGAVYEVAEVCVGSFPTDYRVHLVGRPQGSGYCESRFEPVPEVPRDFRVFRNGSVGSTSHKTQDAASEAGRKNLPEGAEFSVVELVTAAQYKVSKVLEAVA